MSDSEEVEAEVRAEGMAAKAETLKVNLPTYDGSTDPKIWLRSLEKIRKAKKSSKAHIMEELMISGRQSRVKLVMIGTYLHKKLRMNSGRRSPKVDI